MFLLRRIKFLLDITHNRDIMRRYVVVNGFDGALTMLGLIIGFIVSEADDLSVILSVCLGAAIALGMSGLSSAYISESAERKHALDKLEQAMISDLKESAHGDASRWVPLLTALVNGLSPLLISLLILSPIALSVAGVSLPFTPLSPLYSAIIIALLLIFLLGVFLGSIAQVSWLRSGLQTLFVAIVTVLLIYLIAGS
ncbi:MAG: hypothetical protein PF589_10705 [Gammaproteobacteria bacterium]|jgi:predicted membrane protein (TIGR00267 family)|nr:hypothetical protein [Gammaproteobacteria bacterium]